MMRTMNPIIGTAIAVILLPLTQAVAQNTNTQTNDSPWIGVVTSETASIRCGANESYYSVATAKIGDLVRVYGKRQDWLKVETAGHVFRDTVGYVKYPSKDTGVFAAAGNLGTAIGDVDVLAKNIDSNELYLSWRPVIQLHEGDTVQIIDSIITEAGTFRREAYVVHTVRMPSNASAWVNVINIKRATPEQAAHFDSVGGNAGVADITQTPTQDPVEPRQEDSATETEYVEHAIDDDSVSPETVETELEPLSLTGLETAWDKIAKEPVMGAEVSSLRDMYAELLAENGGDLVVMRIATGRIKQLEVWSDLQAQHLLIEELRADLEAKTQKVHDYQSVIDMYGGYVIVGRLALSNTFDGRLRPLMYRIQDQVSGRTLGYLPANKDWKLSGLIGQLVGVTGKSKWDPNWRVNVVQAKRFDILSPTTATITPDIQ